MMSARLFLNCCGVTNALGTGTETVYRAVHASTERPFSPVELEPLQREIHVANVQECLPEVPEEFDAYHSRNNQLLLHTLRQIEPQVREGIDRYGADRVGIVIGTSTTGISDGEHALKAMKETGGFPETFRHTQQELGNTATFAAAILGVSGPAYTVSTACSSSGKVFACARNLIDAGVCDAVLTGGCDTVCNLTLLGFSSLEAVSEQYTNPMSCNRDGICIGEGAALFLVSKEEGPVELLGVGESSDAHHISAPDPEGSGAETSMREALREGGVEPEAVHYINLHGTGTPLNDLMESRAIHRLFGDQIPCSSTKSFHGHTLGAAGAVEAAICWSVCANPAPQVPLPRHLWDGVRDPELPELHLVDEQEEIPRSDRIVCLSNSFAFGGSNCSVLLGSVPREGS